MTTWYREGLVTLTAGSALVAGVGTEWVDNVLPGGIFFTPTGLVEVERVISDTSLKLVSLYGGPTVAGAEYAIAPTQGYVVDLAKQVNAVLGTFGELKDAWQDGTLVGKGVALKGVKDTVADLPNAGNAPGDAWMVDGHLHVWTGTGWLDQGSTVSTPELEALRDAAGTSAGLAIGSALAADTTRKEYEDRVYPGVYSSPPTNKPHSGAASAQGDRCTILVAGVPYEHLRSGGGWVIPNIDAAMFSAPEGGAFVGVSRAVSSTGIALPSSNVLIHMRSAPIDIRTVLPGNYVTDGSVNYSTSIQKVLDYFRDFGGGTLLIPAKLKLLIAALRLYTGTEIIAPDWTSELIVVPNGYGISVNPGSAGSPDPELNQRSIRLSGFQLRGQNAAPVFQEHAHMLNLNGITDILGEMLLIKGFQGDGLYLGSSNTAGVERHNLRVVFDRCTFDGVNADNRNGVSIIDGTDLMISKTKFLNCTRPGQPGAIDIEPNGAAFTQIRRVTLEDIYIKGGYGSGITYLLPPNSALTTPITDLKVNRAVIENKDFAICQLRKLATGPVRDNNEFNNVTARGCGTPFLFDNCHGVTVTNFLCEDAPKQAQLGYLAGNADMTFKSMTLVRCGTTETNAMRIRTIYGLVLDDCLFEDSGRDTVAAGRAIYFADGVGSNITIRQSKFRSPMGRTTYQIGLETATYTLDNSTCRDIDNVFMAGNNDFVVPGRRGLTAAPTTGTWAVGNEVYRTASRGRPTGWRCVAAGTPGPGTWAPLPPLGGIPQGSTAGRPTKATMGVIDDTDWTGTQYTDTTLGGKTLVWQGAGWKDSAGATIA